MKQLLSTLENYGADIKGIMERFVGDEELYETCFSSFLKDPSFQGIGTAFGEENYEQAFEYAHALKGVSGNLGLVPLYNDISKLVEKLREKDYAGLDPLYDKVMQDFEELKSYKG